MDIIGRRRFREFTGLSFSELEHVNFKKGKYPKDNCEYFYHPKSKKYFAWDANDELYCFWLDKTDNVNKNDILHIEELTCYTS